MGRCALSIRAASEKVTDSANDASRDAQDPHKNHFCCNHIGLCLMTFL
jgi:hypothetical protein